ncbi:hypothetical protein D3C80_924400 [compost metagenome]
MASNWGENTFEKSLIIEKYKESNKWGGATQKNFSQNFNACIKKDWVKEVGKDQYILKEDGTSYAKEVMDGNSISKEIKRVKRQKNNLQTNDQ